MRIGAVCALDLSDYNANEQYLEVVHRAETGTPIKNAEEAHRLIALLTDICELLDDWISDQRPSVVDEHGRKPLLPTSNGRPHYP
nr:hypothetical protein [Natrinema gari]